MGKLDLCILGNKAGWRKRRLQATTGHPYGVVIMQGKGIRLKTTAGSRWMLISLSKLVLASSGS